MLVEITLKVSERSKNPDAFFQMSLSKIKFRDAGNGYVGMYLDIDKCDYQPLFISLQDLKKVVQIMEIGE